PGGEDFRRREGARHYQLVITLAQANDLEVQCRRHDELGTSQKYGTGRLGIEDGTRAKQQSIAQGLADLAKDVEGVRHRHGDFNGADAAVGQGATDFHQLAAIRRTDDGNDAAVENATKVVFFAHG